MQDILNHPAVQSGVAPFVAGLLTVLVLGRLKLGGLAVAAAFATAVALISGFTFAPLTVTRKIVLLGLAAPALGVLVDFAFKPTRLGTALLGVAAGVAATWAFWTVLAQKDTAHALMLGGIAAAFLAWVVYWSLDVAADPVRAGAAGLVLGLGAGVAAIFGASALFGQYGIAIGAGAGAFLLVVMVSGWRMEAGATFALGVAMIAGLLATGAMILASLPWHALIALGLIPLAVRLPVPDRLPPWARAVAASVYAFVPAGIACALTWRH